MPYLSFGKAVVSDALRISVLLKTAYIQTYAVDGITFEFANFIEKRFSIQRIERIITQNPNQLFVAYFKGNPVGAEELIFESECPIRHIPTAELSKLYVLDAFQKRGIGSKLLQEAESIALNNGIKNCTLEVYNKNEQAINFYQNNGNKYFAPFDRRNNLNTIGTFNLNERISISANFVYTTGRAITLPIGRFEYQGTVAPIYDNRNANRLPAYHRLDLSVNIDPKKKEGKGRKFESSWNFSVFNAYGRKNPISVSFSEDADNPGQPRTTQFYLPGPIPSITWNFKF